MPGRVIIGRVASVLTILAALGTLAVGVVTAVGAVSAGAPPPGSLSVSSSALIATAPAPSQAARRQPATRDGYPAFQLGAGVKTFHGYGMGSYVVFIDIPATLHDAAALRRRRHRGSRSATCSASGSPVRAGSTRSSTASAARSPPPARERSCR